MMQSKNARVAYIAKFMLYDSSSIICRNLQVICHRYDFNYYDRFQRHLNVNKFRKQCTNDQRTVAQIQELRTVDGDFILDNDDIDFILNFLCCF